MYISLSRPDNGRTKNSYSQRPRQASGSSEKSERLTRDQQVSHQLQVQVPVIGVCEHQHSFNWLFRCADAARSDYGRTLRILRRLRCSHMLLDLW